MDVILTGLPRSGFSVVSALIDSSPKGVCLNAPAWQLTETANHATAKSYCSWLVTDFARTRTRLLTQKKVADIRAANGKPILDSIRDPNLPKNEENTPIARPFTRAGLDENFILAMKHHALYTALLPKLVMLDHFKIITVIRHPLDVILSWMSFPERPMGQGMLQPYVRYWKKAELATESPDKIGRMAQLYDAYCQRYYENREHIHIIKFEDLLADPLMIADLLGTSDPAAFTRIHPPRHVRPREDADAILKALRLSVFAKHFYSLPS